VCTAAVVGGQLVKNKPFDTVLQVLARRRFGQPWFRGVTYTWLQKICNERDKARARYFAQLAGAGVRVLPLVRGYLQLTFCI